MKTIACYTLMHTPTGTFSGFWEIAPDTQLLPSTPPADLKTEGTTTGHTTRAEALDAAIAELQEASQAWCAWIEANK